MPLFLLAAKEKWPKRKLPALKSWANYFFDVVWWKIATTRGNFKSNSVNEGAPLKQVAILLIAIVLCIGDFR